MTPDEMIAEYLEEHEVTSCDNHNEESALTQRNQLQVDRNQAITGREPTARQSARMMMRAQKNLDELISEASALKSKLYIENSHKK